MSESDSKSIVLAAWKVFGSRDQARIERVFTEDAEWFAPPDNATAVALNGPSHLVGNTRIAYFLACEMHQVFRDIQIEFRGVHGDGKFVVIEERMRATLPSGAGYDNDYCFVFELEGERIRRVREYMDTRRGHLQFGE